jgi:multiple sugar transport system substrate-binding protein
VVFKTYLPGDPARQAYEAAMVRWRERYPQITVDQDFTADSATHTTSLTAQLAGGTAPDVAQVEYGWSIDFALDGKLLALDDYLKQNRVPGDEFFPGGLEYVRLGGRQYALPITGHGPLLYCNRDLFQREGLAPPPAQHTWKWADLLAAAQKLTRRAAGKPEESQWGLLVSFGMPYGVSSAIWQNGGTLTDARENPGRTTLDAKAQEAVQWLVDLRYRHQVTPTPDEEKSLGANPFVQGRVGMWWGPSFLTYTNLATIKDFWWDIAFVPKGPEGAPAAATATNHIAALKEAKNPDAAWTLLYFFAAEDGAKLRAQIQNIPPGSRRVFDEVWMKAEPPVRRQTLRDTLAFAKDQWKGRGFGDWQTAVGAALAKAYDGGGAASVPAAIADANTQGTQVLAKQKRS